MTKKKESYSAVPTSTEMKTAIEEIFSELLTQKPKDKPFFAYTGKQGKIDYEVACHKAVAKWINKDDVFSEEDEAKLRAKLEKELPNGMYKIGG